MNTYNGIPMRIIPLPRDRHSIKATYPMTAKGVTVHNTYNDATAANEIAYMHRNKNYTSFHAAIDDKEVLFGVPLNRSTWHAGDGSNGYGNRNHISFEICYSKSGGEKYEKAEENSIKVIAYTLYTNKWDISKLKKHQDWSGKNCPHRILDEKRWNSYKDKISKELNRLNGKTEAVSVSKKPAVSEVVVSKPAPSKPVVSKPDAKPVKKVIPSPSKLKVDGYWGKDTTKALQVYFNTPVDGVISKPSMLVKAIQKDLGTLQDGYISTPYSSMIAAWQRKLKTHVDGKVSSPSDMVKEIQRRLNNGTL